MKKIYSFLLVFVLSFIMSLNVFAQSNINLDTPNLDQHNLQKVNEFLSVNDLNSEFENSLYDSVSQYTTEGRKVLDITPVYFSLNNEIQTFANVGGTMTVSNLGTRVYVDIQVVAPDAITYMSADMEAWDITSFLATDYYDGVRFPSPIQWEQFDFNYTGYNSFVSVKVSGDVTGLFGKGYFYTPVKNYYF